MRLDTAELVSPRAEFFSTIAIVVFAKSIPERWKLRLWRVRPKFHRARSCADDVYDLRRSRAAIHRVQVVDHQTRLFTAALRFVRKRAVSRLCRLAAKRLLRCQV